MDINKLFVDLYDLDFSKLNIKESESESDEYAVTKIEDTESGTETEPETTDEDLPVLPKYKKIMTTRDLTTRATRATMRPTTMATTMATQISPVLPKFKPIRFNMTKPRIDGNPDDYIYKWEYSNKSGNMYYVYNSYLSDELTKRYINDEIFYNFSLSGTNYVIFLTTLKQISENGLIREVKLTKIKKYKQVINNTRDKYNINSPKGNYSFWGSPAYGSPAYGSQEDD